MELKTQSWHMVLWVSLQEVSVQCCWEFRTIVLNNGGDDMKDMHLILET